MVQSGEFLRKLGRYEEAFASYDAALKIKPELHEAWNNRGNSLRKLGRYEEAFASYDAALKIKPEYHEAWYNKACAYALQGNAELALENLQRAIQLNPEKYCKMAKGDRDFDAICEDERFQQLCSQTSSN
ncbi:MAG: tetratricopeptide repeat protein [Cyanobacteriota bacterium]|nr:tetratricopeptide repeat protein [Cyanobacteriota bacterium]